MTFCSTIAVCFDNINMEVRDVGEAKVRPVPTLKNIMKFHEKIYFQ